MTFLFWVISVLTLLSIGFLFFITNFTSPQNKEGQLVVVNLVYFFLFGFVSLAGALTLVLYWLGSLRLKFQRKREINGVNWQRQVMKQAARRGMLISGALVLILILKVFNFANPLNVILVVSGAIVIEVYFFGH